MKKDVRIMLVDDQEIVRNGLRRMLEEAEDIEVIGDYASAEEAFCQLKALSPDIVIMDTSMPGMNGIEATHALKRNGLHYDGDVIVLADSEDYRTDALQAGAASYLLKDVTHMELAQVIRKVYGDNKTITGHNQIAEEAVELFVPPSANASQLMRFMNQLEEGLNGNDSNKCGSITRTIGTLEWGTVVTILVRPSVLVNLVERLTNMPEVDRVEEESPEKDIFSSFPRKSRVSLRSGIRPSKRLRICLETSHESRRELVGMLNRVGNEQKATGTVLRKSFTFHLN